MKIHVPRIDITFDIPDEWWKAAGMVDYIPISSHYRTGDVGSAMLPIEDIAPPLRNGGKFWFRDGNTVVQLLRGMRDDADIPPIQVWSKEKKGSNRHIVRDGFHRFYLSVADGFTTIPIEIEAFDLDTFLENEAKGCPCAT